LSVVINQKLKQSPPIVIRLDFVKRCWNEE